MANDFMQAVSDTIHRAINLRVITMVGDAVIDGPIDTPAAGFPKGPCSSLVTNINLATGDIATIISPTLNGPDSADVHAIHDKAVAQANAIIQGNATMLVTLFKEMRDELKNLPAPTGKTGNGNGAGNTAAAGAGNGQG